jgi:hypothetical protein
MSNQINPEHHKEFVLAALRCVALRVRLIHAELDYVGTALKCGAINPETALKWSEDVAPGCLVVCCTTQEAA